jgi:hypothetical protein
VRAVFVLLLLLGAVRGRAAEARTLLGGVCKRYPHARKQGSLGANSSNRMEARNGGGVR